MGMALRPQEDRMKESQEQAGYMGPENGPFRCVSCIFFIGNAETTTGKCRKVAGDIEEQGCCNLFQPKEHRIARRD